MQIETNDRPCVPTAGREGQVEIIYHEEFRLREWIMFIFGIKFADFRIMSILYASELRVMRYYFTLTIYAFKSE